MSEEHFPPPPPVLALRGGGMLDSKAAPTGRASSVSSSPSALLNHYDPECEMEMKLLCVGMYNTGKSTFLNRWETNLKVKTRATIQVDFYKRDLDTFFPLFLESQGARSKYGNYLTVDGNSSPPANNTTTLENNNNNSNNDSPSHRSFSCDGAPPTENINNNVEQGTSPGQHLKAPHSPQLQRSLSKLGASGGGSFSTLVTGIAGKDYSNPSYQDSTPLVQRALAKASGLTAKQITAARNASSFPMNAFTNVLKGSIKKPLAESDDVKVVTVDVLSRESSQALAGGQRTMLEVYGVVAPATRCFWGDPAMTMGRQFAPLLSTGISPNSSTLAPPEYYYGYYEKRNCRVQTWDIQGQEHARNVSRSYYNNAVGALIFADITRPESLIDAVLWKQDIDSKVFVKRGDDILGNNNINGIALGNGVNAAAPRSNTMPGAGRHRHAGRTASKSLLSPSSSTSPTSHSPHEEHEECKIPCWLVINKCDLMTKNHRFPNAAAWEAQTANYPDLDAFCRTHGFVGWSLASATNNINVSGIIDNMVAICSEMFSREIYAMSKRSKKAAMGPQRAPKPKKNGKCCAQSS